MTHFILHPRLAADTWPVGDLPLSRLLLMNDRRFPWCILVPRRERLRELHELAVREREALMEEICQVSLALMGRDDVEKMNVGALGNLVPQLHVHVIGRHPTDAAWPGPVWGHGQALAYAPDEASRRVDALQDACGIRSAR